LRVETEAKQFFESIAHFYLLCFNRNTPKLIQHCTDDSHHESQQMRLLFFYKQQLNFIKILTKSNYYVASVKLKLDLEYCNLHIILHFEELSVVGEKKNEIMIIMKIKNNKLI